MRLAVVQTDPEFGNVEANVDQALHLMAGVEADLYVLPELFNTGYNFIDRPELESLAEEASGPTFKRIAAFATQRGCHVAYGFAERSSKIYNSAALVGPVGLLGLYRKVHLFYRETLLFSPGDLGFPVFELPFGKVGMMICFDWFYPEAARAIAFQGAEVILHPSNLVLPYCPDAMITRCLENRVFAATANRVGRETRGESDFLYIGTSEIVSPRGEVLKRLDALSSGVAVVEVDASFARDKRLNEFNDLFEGLRPGLYGRMSAKEPPKDDG
jgi:predicted amidohydrolase